MRDVDTIREIVETLEAEGYDVRTDYSGRCMYGHQCLGVTVPSSGAAFELGQLLHEYDSMGRTLSDSMGLDVIVYWPQVNTENYNKTEEGEEEGEEVE